VGVGSGAGYRIGLERYVLAKGCPFALLPLPCLSLLVLHVAAITGPHHFMQIKDAQLENGGRVTALPSTSGDIVDEILGS
jgi:hypothetical protein